MDNELFAATGDAPELRRLLLRELAPMLYPPGPAPHPLWISVTLPGPGGAPRGGLIGLATGCWLTIDLVWLPPDSRGRGVGGALLAEAERLAADHGCRGATVVTTSPFACRFYERNGYVVRLHLPDVRLGYTRTTLQKEFLS